MVEMLAWGWLVASWLELVVFSESGGGPKLDVWGPHVAALALLFGVCS